MAIPDLRHVLEDVKRRYPRPWTRAHTEGRVPHGVTGVSTREQSELWIRLAAWACHQVDTRAGLNGKRGTDVLSHDVISFRIDDWVREAADVIANAGEANAAVAWQPFPPGNESTGKWIAPREISDREVAEIMGEEPGEPPVEPPPHQPPVDPPPSTGPMYALRSFHGTVITFEQSTGRVVGERTEVKTEQKARIIRDPSTPGWGWIEDAFGHNLLTDDDGNVTIGRTDDQSRKHFGLWERDGKLSIQSGKTRKWLRMGAGDEGFWIHFNGPMGGEHNADPGDYETFTVEEVAGEQPGNPPPVHGEATALRVEGNRRWLANDRGRHDTRETIAFGLIGLMIHSPHEAEAWMRQMVSEGFNTFQVLTTLTKFGYWESRRCGPDTPGSVEAMDRVIAYAASLGCYVRLVLIGGLDFAGAEWINEQRYDTYHRPEVRRIAKEWMRFVCDRYRDAPNVLISGGNEPDQIGFRDTFHLLFDDMRECKGLAPHRLMGAGGHTRMGDTVFMKAPMDLNDVHLQRIEIDTPHGREFWATFKRSGEDANIDQNVMPFWHGEPPNFGEGPEYYGRGGRGDIDKSPASAFCMGAVSRSRRYISSFHWDGGLFCNTPGPLTVECMRAFHRGLNAFPMTDSTNLWRGHWEQSPFRNDLWPASDDLGEIVRHVDAGRGPWRVYGIDNVCCTILEPAGFDMTRSDRLKPGRRVRTIDRVEHGDHASGVYAIE